MELWLDRICPVEPELIQVEQPYGQPYGYE